MKFNPVKILENPATTIPMSIGTTAGFVYVVEYGE
jgi:hypothetical protein